MVKGNNVKKIVDILENEINEDHIRNIKYIDQNFWMKRENIKHEEHMKKKKEQNNNICTSNIKHT